MSRLLLFLIFLPWFSCQKELEEPVINDNTMHYDGPNQNAPVLARGISYPAIKFSADFISDQGHTGKRIKAIDFHLSQKPRVLKLLVFGWNTTEDQLPGDLLYEKELGDLHRNSWNHYPMDIDIPIPAEGIWIVFEVDAGDEDLRVIGCDPGPRKINGDIYGLFGDNNPGWTDFYQFSGQETNINWNIRAMLE